MLTKLTMTSVVDDVITIRTYGDSGSRLSTEQAVTGVFYDTCRVKLKPDMNRFRALCFCADITTPPASEHNVMRTVTA